MNRISSIYKDYDIVRLTKDLPDLGLKEGDKGTVLMVLSVSPAVYEVEFLDKDGETIAVDSFDGDLLSLDWSYPE